MAWLLHYDVAFESASGIVGQSEEWDLEAAIDEIKDHTGDGYYQWGPEQDAQVADLEEDEEFSVTIKDKTYYYEEPLPLEANE